MSKSVGITVALLVVLTTAQAPKKRPEAGKLKTGDDVPNLTLEDSHGKKRTKLTELRGKPTVLVFGSCT